MAPRTLARHRARKGTHTHTHTHTRTLPLILTFKGGLPVVEEDDADLAAVVLVHDAGPCVDKVLDGESRARGDAGVGAGRGG